MSGAGPDATLATDSDLLTVALDVEAVSGWIAGLGLGAELPLRFQRVGLGQSNLTFAVADAAS